MIDNERICKPVKIVATSDIGKPLVNDKTTYLLDNQTMTVYAPLANCEMLYTLGLTIKAESGVNKCEISDYKTTSRKISKR